MERATWKRNRWNSGKGEVTVNENIVKRADGKYEEGLDEIWFAEYSEDSATGLWEVEVFKHNVAEWHSSDFTSLEEARQAAHNFYDQV